MIVEILTACAWVAWTPAWDFVLEQDVPAHYFYEDALPGVVAFNPEIEVCQPPGEYDVVYTYSVAGFTGNGIGPESDDLTVVWPSEPVPEPHGALGFVVGVAAVWLLYSRRLRGKG